MPEVADYHRLILALALTVGAIVIGVGNAFFHSHSSRGQLVVVLLGIAISTVTALLFDSPWTFEIGTYSLGLVLAVVLFRRPRIQSWCRSAWSASASTRLRWALLAAVALTVLMSELDRFQQRESLSLDQSMAWMEDSTKVADPVPVPSVNVLTDRGRRLVAIAPAAPRAPEELSKREIQTLSDMNIKYQIIHRAPATDLSNCHGWVFTGGRYSLTGHDVETILTDHDYVESEQPHPGDLCVYRDSRGAISHTALVRAICDDGTVIVEGKWGWLGVYLHLVDDSCYGTNHQYFRTTRNTHLLTITAVSPPDATTIDPTP